MAENENVLQSSRLHESFKGKGYVSWFCFKKSDK